MYVQPCAKVQPIGQVTVTSRFAYCWLGSSVAVGAISMVTEPAGGVAIGAGVGVGEGGGLGGRFASMVPVLAMTSATARTAAMDTGVPTESGLRIGRSSPV